LVTIQIVRRWAMVMAGVALLCGLPVIASALPVSVPPANRHPAPHSHPGLGGRALRGYAESNVVFLAAAWANFSTKDITA
jgi:hypothetical protein